MFAVWFYGSIIFLIYRIFYAGMNTKKLFYRAAKYSNVPGTVFNEDSLIGYVMRSVVTSITWPLFLPCLGVFKLGQRFNKEA